jgi:hypothetical protein
MFANKPVTPITIDRWFNDPQSAPRLREIIENPYFELAAATLLSASRPTFSNLGDPERNSQRQAWLAGYHDFANDLIKLTKQPVAKNNNPDEWAHYE